MAGWRYFDTPQNVNVNTMLLMTDGSVLVHTDGHRDRDWYRLTPDEAGRYHTGRWSRALARGHTATITGVQFNGMSQANSYGDDFQSPTNFPLVRLTRGAGTVRYLRTFGFSSMGVATGSTEVTTEVEVPTGLPAGRWNLAVVANGIASPTRKIEVV